jgi:predicted signal transduction protein with EAL and GGDEF domain
MAVPLPLWRAYMDLTEQRLAFYNTFLVAAASLCLLTSLAFIIPAIAWYRRTKEKQQADRRIRFLAHHDALTSLVNRTRLIEKLEDALAGLPIRGGLPSISLISIVSRRSTTPLAGAGRFFPKRTGYPGLIAAAFL